MIPDPSLWAKPTKRRRAKDMDHVWQQRKKLLPWGVSFYKDSQEDKGICGKSLYSSIWSTKQLISYGVVKKADLNLFLWKCTADLHTLRSSQQIYTENGMSAMQINALPPLLHLESFLLEDYRPECVWETWYNSAIIMKHLWRIKWKM